MPRELGWWGIFTNFSNRDFLFFLASRLKYSIAFFASEDIWRDHFRIVNLMQLFESYIILCCHINIWIHVGIWIKIETAYNLFKAWAFAYRIANNQVFWELLGRRLADPTVLETLGGVFVQCLWNLKVAQFFGAGPIIFGRFLIFFFLFCANLHHIFEIFKSFVNVNDCPDLSWKN